ncbi:GPI ethanolamine phosphate transferase 3 [Trichogramma pretiosum]|uniref:GPI ethanolamine phosphate transferase 3 n=1 Tax=Trichogramma pretiosum TaxID=7493 RepID=UPI0006C95196|nr:GPI ethanolamine phosphate transferase 3 [Trichogramma pretiosum]XP_014225427.1 GPI ethanolamine phosphate transferase 3 [Trichogramma pretiosum]
MTKLGVYIFVLFLTTLSMIFGLLLFTNGFFLHKVAITQTNLCSDKVTTENKPDRLSTVQKCSKPRSRIVLLIIDALKFEFVEDFHDEASKNTFHRNKLPIISKLLGNKKDHSKLFKFIADPPTTTMQRLKSLTTGTLPTFIDVQNNFASDSIKEDNFVTQNKKNGNIFMGDDTWINLYPDTFLRAYPSPSFDVNDLDTVDLKVKDHIYHELENDDWTLLIAHMLGVDHCGHKHGMHHPEMSRKLNETNSFIEQLVKSIESDDKDTMLFIIGDHGMTESGDHGGDTVDEIETALFAYSTKPLIKVLNDSTKNNIKTVNQIDIVPTISLILGNAIPFSNLGNLIIEALPNNNFNKNSIQNDFNFIIDSLWKTIYQVQNYIDKYSSENYLSNKYQIDELKSYYNNLLEKYRYLNNENDLTDFVEASKKYFTTIKIICNEIWVNFNFTLMYSGLVLFSCAMIIFFIIIYGLEYNQMHKLLQFSFFMYVPVVILITFLTCTSLYWLNVVQDFKNTIYFCLGIVPVLYLSILLIQNWNYFSKMWSEEITHKKTMKSIFLKIVLLTITFGLFSNSYIIEENNILLFFLVSLIFFHLFSSRVTSSGEKKNKLFAKFNQKSIYNVALTLSMVTFICLFLRITTYFWKYREEQKHDLKEIFPINYVIGKQASIVSTNIEVTLILSAIALLSGYVILTNIWLRRCGNLVGYSGSEIIARYIPIIMTVKISIFWLMKFQNNLMINKILLYRISFVPSIAYALFIISVIIIFYKPLMVYLVPKRKETLNIYSQETLVPKLFEKMKSEMYKKKEDDDDVAIIYGLATVYSSSLLLLCVLFCIMNVLLLGFMISPCIFFMNIICIGLLFVNAIDRIQYSTSIKELMHTPNHVILCWFLLSEYFFYATGHQPIFSAIHWEAGFLGFDSSLELNKIRAILIGFNTFGSYIIFGLMLPLLIISPFTIKLIPVFAKLSTTSLYEPNKGEMEIYHNDRCFHLEIFSTAGRYILLHALRAFVCMLVATVHKRHLMVWKIFAPKLIFEGLGFMVTTASVTISLLLLLRIENQIKKLICK